MKEHLLADASPGCVVNLGMISGYITNTAVYRLCTSAAMEYYIFRHNVDYLLVTW